MSVHHVVAATLWLLAVALVVAGHWFGAHIFADLGLVATGAAAVTSIRGFICKATTRVVEGERTAFELGRDSVELRSLR